jgi:hypothetical protein
VTLDVPRATTALVRHGDLVNDWVPLDGCDWLARPKVFVNC